MVSKKHPLSKPANRKPKRIRESSAAYSIATAAQPYFNDDGFSLYLGDCLQVLATLPDDSVDMVFADPPYNLSNGGFTVHAGRRVSVNKGQWDKSQGLEADYRFHQQWIGAVHRVLRPGGTLWISGTYHSIYQCGYALQIVGFHILNDIAWFKPNAAPNLSGRYFTASHETLIWARKGHATKHVFNYKDMKYGSWPDDALKKPEKQMRSVWQIGTPRPAEKLHGKHPTQKPMDLLRRIILASTNPGDVVVDPFAGSATTGLAAVQLARKFMGIEMEKRYLDLAILRYKNRVRELQPTLPLAHA